MTRPGAPGRALVDALAARGACALWWPAFEIGPAPDPGAATAALAGMDAGDLAVFVSPNAVESAAALLRRAGRPWPAGVEAAAVGEGTARAIAAAFPAAVRVQPGPAPAADRAPEGGAGSPAAGPPDPAGAGLRGEGGAGPGCEATRPGAGETGPEAGSADPRGGTESGTHAVGDAGEQAGSEALWRQLGSRSWSNRRVLILRAAHGRQWLSDRFAQAGAEVREVAVYTRAATAATERHRRELEAACTPGGRSRTRPLLAVSSSEAVDALEPILQAVDAADWFRAGLAVTLHPRIAARLRQAGFERVQVGALSVEALLAAARSQGVP